MPTSDQLKTPQDSPALQARSEHYPASWHDRVPKRIVMAKNVMSDLPMFLPVAKRMFAHFGLEYDCWVNSHGAVCAILEEGDLLGVKPYEFEVIAWHAMHETSSAFGVPVEENEAVPEGEVWLVSAGERRGVIYNIGPKKGEQ